MLPLLIGAQQAADLILTSRWVDGAEAARLGLAARCCPADRLEDEARSLAHQMAAHAPEAVTAAKRLLRAGGADAVRSALLRERDEARNLRDVLGSIGRGRPTGEGGS